MQPTSNTLALGLAALLAVAAAEKYEHQKTKSKDNPSTASFTSDNLGPAAFMWPPDRVWMASMDNVAPCGSSAAPGNRTKYPLTGGTVALVAQDDYYDSKISISYHQDPTSNDDFTTLVDSKTISDFNPGHECVPIPEAPKNIAAGTNATLQIIYKADWDTTTNQNQTFYACADITYVPADEFKEDTKCFRAVEPGEDDRKAAALKAVEAAGSAGGSGGSGSSGSSDSSSSSGSSGGSGGSSGSDRSGDSESSDSSSSQKMAGGKVAGIVVGSLAGVGAAGAGLLLVYRRRQQQKRKARLARMEENARRDQFPMNKYTSSQNSA